MLCLSVAAHMRAHGSMIMPPTRNAIDAELPPWSEGQHPDTGSIEPYNCGCTNGTDECSNGQSCFWFSQGGLGWWRGQGWRPMQSEGGIPDPATPTTHLRVHDRMRRMRR